MLSCIRLSGWVSALLIMVSLTGCITVGASGKYSILNRPEDALIKLVEDGQVGDAVHVVQKEEAYFSENLDDEDVRGALDSLVDWYAQMFKQINEAGVEVRSLNQDERVAWWLQKNTPSSWTGSREGENDWDRWNVDAQGLAAILQRAAEAKGHEDLLRVSESLSGEVEASRATIKTMYGFAREYAEASFLRYALEFDGDFFKSYVVSVDPVPLMEVAYPKIRDKFLAANFSQMAQFYKTYKPYIPTEDRPTIFSRLWETACDSRWEGDPDNVICKALSFNRFAADREIIRMVPFSVSPYSKHLTVVDDPFDGFGSLDFSGARLRLKNTRFELEFGDSRAETTLHEDRPSTVKGRYQSGTKVLVNPQYTKLGAQAKRDELDYTAAMDVVKVERRKFEKCQDVTPPDPTCSDRSLRRAEWQAKEAKRRVDDTLRRLENTDPNIEEPVYSSYNYSRIKKRYVRVTEVPVSFHDRQNGRTWRQTLVFRKTNAFVVYEGVRGDDLDRSDTIEGESWPPDENVRLYGDQLISEMDGKWR